MTCREIEPELVGYHFGVVTGETRAAVEEHLLGCAACLRAFLELKRAVETGEEGPAPSPAARDRLRRAVAEELGLAPRRWAWWERPLAFGVAGSAVLAALLAVRVLASGPGTPPHTLPAPASVAAPVQPAAAPAPELPVRP